MSFYCRINDISDDIINIRTHDINGVWLQRLCFDIFETLTLLS